ncbi:phage tail assembly chaperone G [Enterococcus sp. DIV1420a]|uniref:phage tail assembly chaperone G n=1 Tax=Enterococcus sp. DIV1420a TaxID=2774672 RepID=UPI003F233C25
MASNLQTTIKLYVKDDEGKYKTKRFKSAEMLPGSVMEDATELQVELEEIVKTNDMEEIRPVLRKCYDFIANVIFEGQFTGQEFLDGMDAREILKITGQLLGSVSSGYDAVYSDQKKK